ncbi:hypothetical protein L2W58_00135 [Dethiosulfovibrio sp. F2B]|uniref:hypothetical protein n=1 Tax=Dethiosulfovibrio faecalis TaxID=2720018 RepID=UPI001F3D3263|nr:hypothetical protein [Dethiosulfovibrio faecalis]MCF4150216.1 hypothetical protein [Dethiosulfovibrio faecalis]
MTLTEELAMYEKAEAEILEGGQAFEDNGLKIDRPTLSHIQKRIKELRGMLAMEEGGGPHVVVW